MSHDQTRKSCPDCGAELGHQPFAGVCPKCLLKRGLDTSQGGTLPVDPGSGPAAAAEAIPEAPGRYTLIGEHARGGMGRVLVVHDESLGRDVALKELLPGRAADGATPTPARHAQELVARFLREARITGQLEHPGITPVHELGRRPDGSLYYTMKLVSGRTLEAAIRAAGSWEERRRLLGHFVDLCHAIAYAHSRGVIHRDIKPSNVLVGDYGETVVVDWGLAKVVGGNGMAADEVDREAETVYGLAAAAGRAMRDAVEDAALAETRLGEVLGTPAYMSPEQAQGQIAELDERCDVYSLGAVLYQILTGLPPFQGSNVEELLAKVREGSPRAVRSIERRVPRELALVCERAMARQRGERTPTARLLAREVERAATAADVFVNPLRPFLSDLVPEVRGLSRLSRALVVSEASRRWRHRNLWPSLFQDLAIVATIAVFSAIGMVAFFALVAFAREHALPISDETLWVAVTAPGIALLLVAGSRTSSRSIAPYVRAVVAGNEARAGGTAEAPWTARRRVAAVCRRIAVMGFAGAMAGAYAAILLMPAVLSDPSPWPILVGAALGAAVEGYLLWRSERRRGDAGGSGGALSSPVLRRG